MAEHLPTKGLYNEYLFLNQVKQHFLYNGNHLPTTNLAKMEIDTELQCKGKLLSVLAAR